MTDIKIGDTLWRRGYRRGWEKNTITKETSQSWIVGKHEWNERKVSKKDLTAANAPGYGRDKFYTDEDHKDCEWLDKWRFRIANSIQGCNDVSKLKQIAKIIDLKV